MEKTLVILKPDAMQRMLFGTIVARFEAKGLKIVGAKMMKIRRELAEQHYAQHKQKPFYVGLVRFMTSQPVAVLALEGRNVIAVVRKMLGATFGSQAEAGTIRGDYGISNSFNLVHASDSPEAAAREIDLFFAKDEIFEYDLVSWPWIYDLSEEK
jgi:nucleoside-diphosphate kinase